MNDYGYGNVERAEYRRLKRMAFPEQMRSTDREWRVANRDKWKIYRKRYYEANRDRISTIHREYLRFYYLAFPERRKAYQTKWRSNNRHKIVQINHIRKARERQNPTEDCSKKIELLRLERFCRWCCIALTKENRSVDHVIPLSRGGSHIPDNLVASCLPCNWSKRNKFVHEWKWISA